MRVDQSIALTESTMIASMTAFGQGKFTAICGVISVEIKAVNSRYLDVLFRMPDEMRLAEQPIRERLAKGVVRGKIEVRASFTRPALETEQQLSDAAMQRVAAQLAHIRTILPDTESPRFNEIINLAGGQQTQTEPEDWAKACLAALEPALAQLLEGRQREGARLALTMLDTAKQVSAIVNEVETLMPVLLATQRDKLAQKLKDTLHNAFPTGFTHISGAELSERIASESSLFALRIDVAEELARLKSHLAELEYLLSGQNDSQAKQKTNTTPAASVGKRLDFLFQEMNREANTLGSKAGSLEMTRAAMNLKLFIEQMREQAMNLE
jgi:uncharacterized protein (TIGR00255 family)